MPERISASLIFASADSSRITISDFLISSEKMTLASACLIEQDGKGCASSDAAGAPCPSLPPPRWTRSVDWQRALIRNVRYSSQPGRRTADGGGNESLSATTSPFGFGLGYTTFEFSDLKLVPSLRVSIPIEMSPRWHTQVTRNWDSPQFRGCHNSSIVLSDNDGAGRRLRARCSR